MNNNCLLLTATINPNGTIYTQRLDPIVRRADYCNAFRKWLSISRLPIVFVENSGSDVTDLAGIADEAQRDVEFVSFRGDYDSSKGKGAGEMCALQFAQENSRLLALSQGFFKDTGRLFVSNFSRIVAEVEHDQLDIKCSLSDRLRRGDSRFFFAKRKFIKDYLVRYADVIDDSKGFYFEHAFARAVHRATSDGWGWNLFKVRPRVEGVSASLDFDYRENPIMRMSSSVAHRLKYKAFQV